MSAALCWPPASSWKKSWKKWQMTLTTLRQRSHAHGTQRPTHIQHPSGEESKNIATPSSGFLKCQKGTFHQSWSLDVHPHVVSNGGYEGGVSSSRFFSGYPGYIPTRRPCYLCTWALQHGSSSDVEPPHAGGLAAANGPSHMHHHATVYPIDHEEALSKHDEQ